MLLHLPLFLLPSGHRAWGIAPTLGCVLLGEHVPSFYVPRVVCSLNQHAASCSALSQAAHPRLVHPSIAMPLGMRVPRFTCTLFCVHPDPRAALGSGTPRAPCYLGHHTISGCAPSRFLFLDLCAYLMTRTAPICVSHRFACHLESHFVSIYVHVSICISH